MKHNEREDLARDIRDSGANSPALKLDTRSKILQAAIKIFASQGYDGASLRQITNLAGVNHGSVKYHYNSKLELWQAAVTFLYEELEGSIRLSDGTWNDLSTREKLEHAMRAYIRFIAKTPELPKITMFETMHDSPRLDWLTEKISGPYAKGAIDWVVRGKEEGIFPANIPDMNMFYILLGASRYMFFVAPEADRVFGKKVISDDEIKRHEDAVIQLFLGHMPSAED